MHQTWTCLFPPFLTTDSPAQLRHLEVTLSPLAHCRHLGYTGYHLISKQRSRQDHPRSSSEDGKMELGGQHLPVHVDIEGVIFQLTQSWEGRWIQNAEWPPARRYLPLSPWVDKKLQPQGSKIRPAVNTDPAPCLTDQWWDLRSHLPLSIFHFLSKHLFFFF
jgi:hypothetical protein